MNFKLLALGASALLLLGVTTYLTLHSSSSFVYPHTEGANFMSLNAFSNYIIQFNKHYSSQQEADYRYTVFLANWEKIKQTNSDATLTYKAGINQFTDMTQEECIKKYLMNNLPITNSTVDASEFQNVAIADTVDWRTKGAVTPIKNQGQCGSCWSFSTTGVLEGSSFIQGKKLQSFSEQQLVDCCGADGFQCQGCSGAWPEWALNWVKAKGITTESSYPYTGVDGTCKVDSGDFKISSYTMLTANDEKVLQAAVNVQPVSICVDASSWFSYSSGIFNGCTSSTSLDHAVLLVGYQAGSYYTVKNSWDTTWGEKGYIRLPMGTNACGVAAHAITTTL